MSSRALRRLREEKEAALLAAEDEEDDDDEEGDDDDHDDDAAGGGGNKAFLMMLEEESSSSSSSSEDEASASEGEDDVDDDGESDGNNAAAAATSVPAKSKRGGKDKGGGPRQKKGDDAEEKEEEDLDAILSDMKIQNGDHDAHAQAQDETRDNSPPSTARSLLLSRRTGFDAGDLDLDRAMRSLLGGAAGVGGGNPHGGDDFMVEQQQQQQQRGGRRGAPNPRGRRALTRKYLWGRPRPEWGKPPSYVGGGIGTKELTKEVLEEERRSWSVPWPYNLSEDDDGGDGIDDGSHPRATISPSRQRWFTLQMSDTYQEHNYVYQQMLSSAGGNHSSRYMHDPNSLAMFVADHPYFCETLLQLAMVLYYVNDRGRGNDLLRRCLFLYETALPSNLLPSAVGDSNVGGDECEILIDIDRNPNSGLFAALFRVMQTSGMAGCHDNALATGRFLLSLDPLRDPMGVLLILDYYALASRRTVSREGLGEEGDEAEVEAGAAFVVDLVESGLITIHHKDPLTDRHHRCRLVDMPNWAYSYALALYRLSKCEEIDPEEKYEERAEDELVQALRAFPMVLPKLLEMNKVNTRDRSFRTDWPALLPHFGGDVIEGNAANVTVEGRVAKASGEHLVRIFVERCHKLWKEDSVVAWMYKCAERAVRPTPGQNSAEAGDDVPGSKEVEGCSPPPADAEEAVASGLDGADESEAPPPLTSKFSPALARYAQCDPSEYEDAFRTFPPEAIALDPNIVAPAMAFRPGQQRRFFRRGQQQQRGQHFGGGADMGQDPLEALRNILGGGQDEMEVLDPDSPILQLYLQSLLPWAQVEGVRPPPRG